MSANNIQTNGKKSSNSSAVNTPAGTPVTNGNSQNIPQNTPPPPNNNAPKYGKCAHFLPCFAHFFMVSYRQFGVYDSIKVYIRWL